MVENPVYVLWMSNLNQMSPRAQWIGFAFEPYFTNYCVLLNDLYSDSLSPREQTSPPHD